MRIIPAKDRSIDLPFEDWGVAKGLELVATEREWARSGDKNRWYVHFVDAGTDSSAETMDGSCLVGTYGNGSTPEAAKADYEACLSSKRLVVHAMDPNLRREIQCPKDWVKVKP